MLTPTAPPKQIKPLIALPYLRDQAGGELIP